MCRFVQPTVQKHLSLLEIDSFSVLTTGLKL